MMFYRAAIDLSPAHIRVLTKLLHHNRTYIGTKWRALTCRRQAFLVLVHLRTNNTYRQLAASFRIGIGTVCRYIHEAITLLATTTKPLADLLHQDQFVILDGTIIATDRVADLKFYCGHKHRFGVNIQAVLSFNGEVIWTSAGLPGAVHDLTAARQHRILETFHHQGVTALADAGYIGAGPQVWHPARRNRADRLQRHVDAHNARLRCRGERGFAQLKTWKILTRYRGCPSRVGDLVAAISQLL